MPGSSTRLQVSSSAALSLIAAVVLVLAGWLGGCQAGGGAGTPPSAAAGVVEGRVFYRERIALPPGTVMTVRLLDVTDSTRPKTLATERRTIGPLNPAPFTLRFSPRQIREDRAYQVRAELDAAGQRWGHEQQYPVLSGGAPAYVEIRVHRLPVAAPR
ncbi:MAG: YbaY family lipoprotein [Tepidisphaerales bacterium]